jgi:Pyridoxamine 5'-phosphate oxidase
MASTTSKPGLDAALAARNIVRQALKGALATLDRAGPEHPGGHPYASLVTVATTPQGRPIFLLSGLALHTQNLKADPRASLMIDATSLAGDPLAGGRVTLIGRIETAAPTSRTRCQPVRRFWRFRLLRVDCGARPLHRRVWPHCRVIRRTDHTVGGRRHGFHSCRGRHHHSHERRPRRYAATLCPTYRNSARSRVKRMEIGRMRSGRDGSAQWRACAPDPIR